MCILNVQSTPFFIELSLTVVNLNLSFFTFLEMTKTQYKRLHLLNGVNIIGIICVNYDISPKSGSLEIYKIYKNSNTSYKVNPI
jgi:hypothetical protein